MKSRLPRFGTALLITAGVAPDLDYASYFAGASAFLGCHRSALHAIPGAALLSCVLAGAFCALDKRWRFAKSASKQALPLGLAAGVAICSAGVAAHDLLDLASGEGLQLLWPFRLQWFRWNLAESFDPWLLALLLAGSLIPQLFRLVSEEVGAPKRRGAGSGVALFTLALLAAYFGARAYLHGRAHELLLSAEYHGREPLSGGAFPSSVNPFAWRGVVSTENTIEEIDLNLASDAQFNPDRSLTHYKPAESPQLQAAEKTAAAQGFLRYAEFPLASVARREDGYRVELRDVRFPVGDERAANMFVRLELSGDLGVLSEELRYASAGP